MAHIERSNWLPQTFGQALELCELLRAPEMDAEPQTQIFAGEVIRLLGTHEGFHLAMKFEGTLGWIRRGCVSIRPALRDFSPPPGAVCDAEGFLRRWKGAPYKWGGLTERGIDCSGFTQRFFHEVHGKTLPKNSRDQRRFGTSIAREQARHHDLLFVLAPTDRGPHHVGVIHERQVWHASHPAGVIHQPVDEFLAHYRFEEAVRIL